MKKISFFIILALLLLPLISSPLLATTRGISITAKEGQSLYLYKDYCALVVGISDYERWPKLPNAVNDATEVAAKLKELGFEVRLSLNPTSREMKSVLSDMVYDMGGEEDRAILFYYAGHGETEALADKTKMGYIIPKDCPLLKNNPKGFATHAISMRDIESASMRIRSKHVVMVFDSCFSGSLFALVRAVPHDITEKSTLPVRQYITAGREDEQVPDKSMFKRCFLVGLEGDADLTGDGYITGSELGMYLSDKVVNYTHRRQHPQYGKINNPDLDRGDFIFALKTPSKPSSQVSKVPPPSLKAEKKRLAEERASIERERRELEELKTLMEEKKKLEDERRHLAAEKKRLASIPKTVKETKASNGRFIAYANGTVVDTKTGLEWIAGPDKGITYDEARTWAENLTVKGSGWRMPTLKELKSLYQQGAGKRNMTPLLKTTGWYVWGGERGADPWYSWSFDFKNNTNYWLSINNSFQNRAFAVRSRK